MMREHFYSNCEFQDHCENITYFVSLVTFRALILSGWKTPPFSTVAEKVF